MTQQHVNLRRSSLSQQSYIAMMKRCSFQHGNNRITISKQGDFWRFFGDFFVMFFLQFCFICRPLDSTASEDAGIELRAVANLALAIRRIHSARSHPQPFLVTIIKNNT
jgi:hypothetical protein